MDFVRLTKKDDIAWIEWDHPHSKANLLSEKALNEFSQIVDEVLKSNISVACLISKKPSVFIAGADLHEIQNLKTAEDFSMKIQQAHQVFKKLEESSCTFIAAIHGACLGGGTELVLACDYRIATLETQIGLPEVNLGLIPGFGGCVRLPKWVGFLNALQLIVTGQSVSAKKAHRLQLVDQVVPVFQLEDQVKNLAKSILKGEKKKKRSQSSLPAFVSWLFRFYGVRRLLAYFFKRQVLKKTKGFYPAPLQAIKLLTKIHTWSLSKALEEEKKTFCQLAVSSISQNLIQLFFMTEDIKKKQTGWPQNEVKETVPIKTLGVVGAGVMGREIAYTSAYKGLLVRLHDQQEQSLVSAKKHISSLFSKQMRRKKLTSFTRSTLESNIVYAQDEEGLSSMDIVIEAIVEDLKIKQNFIQHLSSVLSPGAILASNTSSLSVTEMSKAYARPADFIGMHFFNPVHRMPLVEVIRGAQTSDETVARVFQMAKKLGKYPIIVQDSPGFLVNRLLLPWLTEALWLLGEGQGVRFIDRVFTKGYGWPMGPFRLMDEVGLDVCLKVMTSFQNAGLKLSIPSFAKELAQDQVLGKKTSIGFYHYTKGQARSVNSVLENKFRSSLKTYHTLDKETCLKRGLYRMINEASKVLEEKVTNSPSQVDLALIMGAGFPPFRGGLLRYADFVGVKNILDSLDQWVNAGIDRFEASSFLKNLLPHGSFYKNDSSPQEPSK